MAALNAAQAAYRLPPVNTRHGQVHQDRVGPQACCQQVQAVVAAGGGAQLKAQRLQQVDQQLAVGFLVVHHQHLAARAGIGAAHAHRRQHGPRGHATVHLGQEQLDGEHRALPRRAGGAELAAHQVGQHLGNGQPQPRAGSGLGRRRATCKGLENLLYLLHRQAGAGVFDLYRGHFACIAHTQGHAPLRRELDGVAQQVDEDLAHALFVGAHHLGQRCPRRQS
jgi:hypothetical protein